MYLLLSNDPILTVACALQSYLELLGTQRYHKFRYTFFPDASRLAPRASPRTAGCFTSQHTSLACASKQRTTRTRDTVNKHLISLLPSLPSPPAGIPRIVKYPSIG
jgi:hypothetical protein